MPDWIKNSLSKIWEGILKHLGVVFVAFVFSGGYLIAINKLKEFQQWVRDIPTDYVLTPLVLLVVILLVVLRINYRQSQQLSRLETQPPSDDKESRFVTHLGVWWKIYPDSEYIEDFPYCPCCEPKQKLVQIEWHPDEVYKCPKTNTEIKLYDTIPWKKEKVLDSLYRSYFGGARFEEELLSEFDRIKRLHPESADIELVKKIFNVEPFNRIPRHELDEIFSRFSTYGEIFHFFRAHYKSYRRYFRKNAKQNES